MKMNGLEEKQMLESIANEYLKPDTGRIVDKKLLGMIAERVLPMIKGPEILEMGFGDDVWTSKIIEKFGYSSIVDASQILLNKAKTKYGDKIETYNFLVEDFMPHKKYDTVIASFVMEHVKDPIEVLKKASTWINKEGHIIIVVPNADSFHRRVAVCMGLQKRTDEIGPTDRHIGHRRIYTIEKMKHDIALSGLNILRKMGLFLKFIPQSMMVNFSDELLKGYTVISESVPMEYCSTLVFDVKCKNKQKGLHG